MTAHSTTGTRRESTPSGDTCHPVVGDGTNKVPIYSTGCSNCGCVWDGFYIKMSFMGPPNYCPRCGARVDDS